MGSGSLIRYRGARGDVWRIKFVDASGRQVQKSLGPAVSRSNPGGMSEAKAKKELRRRLGAVDDGYRQPEPTRFAAYVEGWADEYCDRKDLKLSTREGYRQIVALHLVPAFGSLRVGEIDHDRIDRYVRGKKKDGYAARTVARHLAVLSLICADAQRDRLLTSNPVALVERPPPPRRGKGWRILTPTEIGAVERAFAQIAADAPSDEERAWRRQARAIFLVLVDTGIRRGEVLGLRWRHVRLADPAGPRIRIEQTFVRQRIDTPKSAKSERTIKLSPPVANELFDHRARSSYLGDDEHVFPSATGQPFDVARYGRTFRLALKAAGIEDYVRPFHDQRHSSITNGAAAGMAPLALQKRAGHSSYSTTQLYIDDAGVEFDEEAAKLGARLWGSSGGDAEARLEAVAAAFLALDDDGRAEVERRVARAAETERA